MAQSANSIKRVDSSHYFTELVFEDPEATSVETVKHSLSEKEGTKTEPYLYFKGSVVGIPSRQRRLSFPLSPSKAGPHWESFPDQIRNELHFWQKSKRFAFYSSQSRLHAIIFVNGKTLGRLVEPNFTFSTSQDSIQSYEFAFSTFHFAKKALNQDNPSALALPVDSAFVTSEYTIQLFGRCGTASFALPFRYRVSGCEAATKVSLQQQKADYIQRHKELRRKKEHHSTPLETLQEVAISCDLPKEPTVETDSSDMEAVLHSGTNTAEPKTKDFNTCKDNSVGKVSLNRGKKPKKKKANKVIKNGSVASGGGSYDRSHLMPHTYGYTSVTSNRQRGCRAESDSVSEQHMDIVNKLMQCIAPGLDHGEGDVLEKQSDESPLAQDGDLSREVSSPDNTGQTSPTRSESDGGGGLERDPDTARKSGEAKKKEQQQPTVDFNDFEDDEVYIHRNHSVGSLVRSGSGALPTVSGAECVVSQSAAPPVQSAEPVPQNKPPEKQAWKYVSGPAISPATSPHRINFSSANGLLQANGEARSAIEDPSSGMSQPTSHTRLAGAVYPSTVGEYVMDHNPQGNEMEQGFQRATLQALMQLGGSSHQPMTTLSHQMAAHLPMGNVQLPIMGHPPPSMPHVFAMAPHQQMLQGHHPVLSNMSNLSSLHGLHLGALLAQEPQMRGMTPEPMRNAREDFRKHKDDVHEDSSCFYMKPSNDLDRFLTEATPILKLDPALDAQKAMDQLTLEDVWKFYYECSMLGKEIPLQGSASAKENYCGPCTAYYLPYLSGMQIFTPEDVPYVTDASNIFLCDVDGWPSLMRMQCEQFEVNPPWFRLPLYDRMDELSVHVPELKQLKVKDLHPASWFCVAWYPLYRIPDAPLGTRFLTFHGFQPSLHSTNTVGRGGQVPLAVYGLEWYNMSDELWLDNIKITKPIRSPSPTEPNDAGRYEGAEVYSAEQHHWMLRIKELRRTAKLFARGLSFRRTTPHGMADANTHHHDFEYFYERN